MRRTFFRMAAFVLYTLVLLAAGLRVAADTAVPNTFQTGDTTEFRAWLLCADVN